MSQNRCDFVALTGRSRKAQPAEKCTFFVKGERLAPVRVTLPGEEAVYTALKPGEKHDWEPAMELYKKGMNDGEISKLTGIPKGTIHGWRRRHSLPANWGRRGKGAKNGSAEP